jgi:hypothetical protein
MEMNMALRDKISIKKQVRLDLTPDDWQLYTTSMDCKRAAIALNDTFEFWFNNGASREELMKYMYNVMKIWSEYGAADSEPMYVLDDLVDTVYA